MVKRGGSVITQRTPGDAHALVPASCTLGVPSRGVAQVTDALGRAAGPPHGQIVTSIASRGTPTHREPGDRRGAPLPTSP